MSAPADTIAPRKVTALVGLNRQGLLVLGVTTAIGASIGALFAQRRLLGATVGGALGFALPVSATLLILLPLKSLSLENKEHAS